MVVKKRAMHSPTQEAGESLPMHDKNSVNVPLHMQQAEYAAMNNSLLEESPKKLHWHNSSDSASSTSSSPKSLASSYDSLPSWSSRPISPVSDSHIPPIIRDTSDLFAGPQQRRASFFLLAFLLVGFAALYTSRVSVTEAAAQVSVLRRNRDKMSEKLTKTENEFSKLRREISAMDVMMNKQQRPDSATVNANNQRLLSQRDELQSRLQSETAQVNHLKERVQQLGRDTVVEKFGEGRLRVEIDLVFPDRQIGPHKFTIEMAPLDLMPHSVHTFLEMVSAGLLDGCSFLLNAMHVLKAAPLPYDGSSAADKATAFTSRGLESVSFKEYNELYPHKKYSVGFAADGSPSFYINTEDNTEIHAGDPCFGQIVDGFDAVKRLESQPVRSGIWFEKRIGIKSARIVEQS